ncbi:RING-H2 finger protein [bacterium]|nr:RING-H2 finger protein [bacterium]
MRFALAGACRNCIHCLHPLRNKFWRWSHIGRRRASRNPRNSPNRWSRKNQWRSSCFFVSEVLVDGEVLFSFSSRAMVTHTVCRQIVRGACLTSRLRLNQTFGWQHLVDKCLRKFPTNRIVGFKFAEEDSWSMGPPDSSWRVPAVSTTLWLLCEVQRPQTREELQVAMERIEAAREVLEEAGREMARIMHPEEAGRNVRPRLADQTTCSICLEALPAEPKTMRCGHSFHGDCLADWLITKSRVTCPNCRSCPR